MKKPLYLLKHEYLAPWLHTAMKGLTNESRARIREEISAHFDEAVDLHLGSGLSEVVAAGKAVESLGSARAARRAFRKIHLTRFQADTVRQFSEWKYSLVFASLACIFLSVILVESNARHVPVEWLGPVGALLVLSLIVRAIGAPYLFHHGNEHSAVALGACADLVLWGAIAIAGTNLVHLWYPLIYLVASAIVHIPLLLKLNRLPAGAVTGKGRQRFDGSTSR